MHSDLGFLPNEKTVNLTLTGQYFILNLQIPVFAGADGPLVYRAKSAIEFHGEDGFNDISFDHTPDVTRVQKETAISAMHRLVHENKGIWPFMIACNCFMPTSF